MALSLKQIDPLLAVAKLLVLFLQAVFAIGVIGLLAGGTIMLFAQGEVAEQLAKAGSDAPLWLTMTAIIGMILAIAVLIAALFVFFRHLGRVIDTVAAGDPFTPVNARRLSWMAWISLAIQFWALLIEVVGYQIGRIFPDGVGEDSWHFTVDGDMTFPGNGLLLALVLFILARVFRKGAQMREDLEGTV